MADPAETECAVLLDYELPGACAACRSGFLIKRVAWDLGKSVSPIENLRHSLTDSWVSRLADAAERI